MQTQSFQIQTPLLQGFMLPKRKTVCSGAGNTYNWSTLSNAQKKSILDNYILSAQSGDYECLNSWIQIFINSTGQSFGQRVDAQYAGNKKFNVTNVDVQELIGHAKNRLELSELYIYGSGRLGQMEPNLTLAADAERSFVYNPFTGAEIDPSTSVVPPVYTTSATHKSFIIGQKRYEISNHHGNVSSVITDRKFGVPLSGTDPTISYYLADIVTATDYDPYGQVLPGRVWNRSGYRFGFNGQEFDSELGEVWSAEFWEYDASLGRRWDIDPIDLPWQSPYLAFDCNPIAFNDPLGLAAAPTGDGDGDKKKGKKSRDMRTSDEAKSDATSQKGASLSPENKNRVDITQKGFWNRPEKSWRKDLKVSAQDKDGRVMYKTPGGTWVDIDEHSGTVRAFDETEKHWRDVWDRDTWNKRTDSNRNAAAAEFTDWIRDLLITALSFELETAAFRMVIPKVATRINKVPKVKKAKTIIKKDTGKHYNIYGEGESEGAMDIAVDSRYANGRPLSKDFPSNSAAKIEINNSPINPAELDEILRLSKPGTIVSYTAPSGSKYFAALSNFLQDKASFVSTSTKVVNNVELKTVTFEIK